MIVTYDSYLPNPDNILSHFVYMEREGDGEEKNVRARVKRLL